MEGIEERIGVDVETRIQELVQAFRDQHQHPANLAMHAAAALLIARGALRMFRGQFFRGLFHGAAAIGLMVGGHQIEGNDPFAMMRQLEEGGA